MMIRKLSRESLDLQEQKTLDAQEKMFETGGPDQTVVYPKTLSWQSDSPVGRDVSAY